MPLRVVSRPFDLLSLFYSSTQLPPFSHTIVMYITHFVNIQYR